MATERLSDLGYLAISKETVPGTSTTVPSIYVPVYGDSLNLDVNNTVDSPIIGQPYEAYQVLPGMRNVNGSVEIMGEPNTAAYFLDMLYNKTGTTGAGPYTHAYGLNTTDSNSYTIDIARGNVVHRHMGCKASEIKPTFVANEMHLNIKLTAFKSFISRGITSISTTTVVLDTLFSKTPNAGLLVGDLVTITKADGTSSANFTVATVNVDGVTITLNATAAAFATGDKLTIRPATPSLSLLTPFLWSNTEFRFGATASAALSATHTPLEEGSGYTLIRKFKDDGGEHRSGNQDAVSIVRTRGNADLQLKKFFDLPLDQENFQNISGQAVVVRHFSGATNQYELRVTLNDIRIMSGTTPPLKPGEILYSDMKLQPVYKSADGQALDVKVINNVATV